MGLGSGIALRSVFLRELAARLAAGDAKALSSVRFAEAIAENFLERGGAARRALLEIAEAVPITLHGLTLSIGGTDPLDEELLRRTRALIRDTRARWFTDHLCFSSAGGIQFHNLLPLPFSREAVKHVVKRIRKVQASLDVPFGLENPSFYAVLPGSEMTESQFLADVLEQADCGLLLDINNVFVNSVNHGPWLDDGHAAALDRARQFLRELPLERVIEVHVAGHSKRSLGGSPILLDTHGAPVPAQVAELLRDLHRVRRVGTLLLERENNVPPLDEILDEARTLWELIEPRAPRAKPREKARTEVRA